MFQTIKKCLHISSCGIIMLNILRKKIVRSIKLEKLEKNSRILPNGMLRIYVNSKSDYRIQVE